MKKILALALCLVALFALCACGEEKNSGAGTNGNSSVVSQVNGNNDKDQGTKKEGKEAYLGAWVHERTDAEPFRMTLEFKDNGKGKNGNTDIEWTYDDATKQISITIIYPDGTKSDPSPAKLTDAGEISWERDFNIKTQDGEFLKFDKAIFVKQ